MMKTWQARHKHERFVRISRSMAQSPAWMSLGKNAIRLYFECMEWTYDAENRKIEKASKELYPATNGQTVPTTSKTAISF